MSDKAKLARDRNWTKARLMGGITSLSNGTFTESEMFNIRAAQELIADILKNWDIGSRELGLIPQPKFNVIFKDTKEVVRRGITKKEAKIYEEDNLYIIEEYTI